MFICVSLDAFHLHTAPKNKGGKADPTVVEHLPVYKKPKGSSGEIKIG